MLIFKNINIVFACLLAVTIIACLWGIFHVWPIVALFFIYTVILFYGSYYIGSCFYIPVTCKATTTAKKIALSFDDGPAAYTDELLAILAAHNINATFFCIGKNVQQSPEAVKKMHASGHIIGNHSYHHHFWFDIWSANKVYKDLEQTHQLIKDITGLEMRWFRPPFGVTNPNIGRAVQKMGYHTIGWSIRSLDTMAKNPDLLFSRVTKRLHPGAIILFHDTCGVTIKMLPGFITYVKEQGYEIVPMDKLLNLQSYAD